MPSTDWIAGLKVAELKEELKKRDLPVAGKKAELAARLEAYVAEHEGSEAPAAEEPAGEEAPAPAAPTAPEEPASAPEEPAPAAESAPEPAPEGTDVDLDYGDSEDDGPAAAPAPAAAKKGSPASKKAKESPRDDKKNERKESSPKLAPAAASKDDKKKERREHKDNDSKAPRGGGAGIFGAAMASIKPTDEGGDASKKRPAPEPSAPATDAAAEAADTARPQKQAKPDRSAEPKAQADVPMEDAGGDGPPPPSRSPTRALMIEGFVRPFTVNAARDLLSRSGTVVAMWMPNIKNVCWAVFASKAEAAAARAALWRLRWPETSPKTLTPRYASLAAAEKAIGEGEGNAEFKIERIGEDGPEDEEGGVEGHPAAGGDRGQKSAKKEKESAKKEEKKAEKAPEQPPLGVKDLRELLSRRPSVGGEAAAEAAAATPPRPPPAPGVSIERLNQLFRRTDAKPAIYWQPLSEEAVAARRRAAAAVRGGRR